MGLKYNALDKTYENGDKTAMFAFDHPQTEQMKATTDYRYIGNVPNNYVKFNCDNDGTNCEIWRIIGVFEVDDGNGNYEQRIKLVRGSAFATEMQWDDDSDGVTSNEWADASLKRFLNGDYLNKSGDALNYGLKQLAQSQISNAKYYLGGRNSEPYGSGEDIYNWERGTTEYNNLRSSYWIGNVGLIYPSDYVYTYSKNVDNTCYLTPETCYEHYEDPNGTSAFIEVYPNLGWIYNSNNLEGQLSPNNNWLLSPNTSYFSSVFEVRSSGNIVGYYNFSNNYRTVRPVVYLKSSISIISGEGTELNPYVLG